MGKGKIKNVSQKMPNRIVGLNKNHVITLDAEIGRYVGIRRTNYVYKSPKITVIGDC